jgi:hypothetical protein
MFRKPRFELTVETSNMALPWYGKPRVSSSTIFPYVDMTVRWGFTRATVKFWLE